jgi:transposase
MRQYAGSRLEPIDSLSGEPQAQIAKRLGTRPNTISKWRIRFARHGLKGLTDAPRSGKPPIYGPALRTKLLAMLETPPPKGQSSWDGLALAKAVGAKKSIVYALLQKDGIQLQRTRSWCVSTDPQLPQKRPTLSACISLRRKRRSC